MRQQVARGSWLVARGSLLRAVACARRTLVQPSVRTVPLLMGRDGFAFCYQDASVRYRPADTIDGRWPYYQLIVHTCA